MIPALHADQGSAFSEAFDDAIQKVAGRERVFSSTDKQHRTIQFIEMLIAELIRLSGRMQRVSQEDQPVHSRGSRNIRCNPSAHRFASNEEPLRVVSGPNIVNNAAI